MMELNFIPLVSVITVVRNDVKNIERTLCSIFEQTYQNIELIIIDGASTDGTKEVIDKWMSNNQAKEGRILQYISERDKGVYDAMNKGIRKSHGAFVNFMNSGDVFHAPNSIEILHLEAVVPNTIVYGDTNTTYGDITQREKPREFFKTYMKFKGIGICHQSMFFPGEELRKRQYDLSYRIVADYALSYDMWKTGTQFLYRDIIVADYKWGNGISSNPFGLIEVYRENARVAGQQWNLLFWAKMVLEYYRLYTKKLYRNKKSRN